GDRLHVRNVARQRRLGIGAAVDVFEEDVGESAPRELPIVRDRSRAQTFLPHQACELGARSAGQRKSQAATGVCTGETLMIQTWWARASSRPSAEKSATPAVSLRPSRASGQ